MAKEILTSFDNGLILTLVTIVVPEIGMSVRFGLLPTKPLHVVYCGKLHAVQLQHIETYLITKGYTEFGILYIQNGLVS